jgi:HSP20 family molecular chaperone IbpA
MTTDDPDDWMWERARALLENELGNVRRAFTYASASERAPSFQPKVDLFENAAGLWVLVALPGVCAEHVRVTVARDHLVVDGHRALPEAFRKADVHRLEQTYGRFRRRIDLPPGRFALGQEQLVQGCLVLRLTRIEEPPNR